MKEIKLKTVFTTIGIIMLLFCFAGDGYSQNTLSMEKIETRREVSMDGINGKRTDGIYRYYAKGETKPFTGVLFSKYANGNFSSWQEYEDGIGQGKWINYYENGNYKEIGYYNQNLVEGPIKKYYENGSLRAEGNYKDWRIKIGEWKYYDDNEYLESTVNYGDKGSIEEVKDFYERGKISYSWYSDILAKNGFNE